MAPQSARLMIVGVAGKYPSAPKTASAAVIGTTSATVIQSRPSMKLTRLTNHSPPTINTKRSIQSGMNGALRKVSGKVQITSATLSACSRKRGATPIGRMSSATPTAAIRITATRSGNKDVKVAAAGADQQRAPAAAMIVAATTAAPPPCGVGTVCDERAFGLASAMRRREGRIAMMNATAALARPSLIATSFIGSLNTLDNTTWLRQSYSARPREGGDPAFCTPPLDSRFRGNERK